MQTTKTASNGHSLNALKAGDTFYREESLYDDRGDAQCVVTREDIEYNGEVTCEFTDKSNNSYPFNLNFSEYVIRINEAA